ncbi:unnamed protein product [Amoebophrya sp. A120]|nr:unnamed protein product [Amoebophrya sp. A120]|eukprot:GSA120T00002106001.1
MGSSQGSEAAADEYEQYESHGQHEGTSSRSQQHDHDPAARLRASQKRARRSAAGAGADGVEEDKYGENTLNSPGRGTTGSCSMEDLYEVERRLLQYAGVSVKMRDVILPRAGESIRYAQVQGTGSLGNGRPMVLVHGFAGGLACYYRMMKYLAERWQGTLYFLDLPGMGCSLRKERHFDTPEEVERFFVRRLKFWLDVVLPWYPELTTKGKMNNGRSSSRTTGAAGATPSSSGDRILQVQVDKGRKRVQLHEKFVLVAHSFGAYLSTAFANEVKPRVAGLILLSPCFGFPKSRAPKETEKTYAESAIEALFDMLHSSGGPGAIARDTLGQSWGEYFFKGYLQRSFLVSPAAPGGTGADALSAGGVVVGGGRRSTKNGSYAAPASRHANALAIPSAAAGPPRGAQHHDQRAQLQLDDGHASAQRDIIFDQNSRNINGTPRPGGVHFHKQASSTDAQMERDALIDYLGAINFDAPRGTERAFGAVFGSYLVNKAEIPLIERVSLDGIPLISFYGNEDYMDKQGASFLGDVGVIEGGVTHVMQLEYPRLVTRCILYFVKHHIEETPCCSDIISEVGTGTTATTQHQEQTTASTTRTGSSTSAEPAACVLPAQEDRQEEERLFFDPLPRTETQTIGAANAWSSQYESLPFVEAAEENDEKRDVEDGTSGASNVEVLADHQNEGQMQVGRRARGSSDASSYSSTTASTSGQKTGASSSASSSTAGGGEQTGLRPTDDGFLEPSYTGVNPPDTSDAIASVSCNVNEQHLLDHRGHDDEQGRGMFGPGPPKGEMLATPSCSASSRVVNNKTPAVYIAPLLPHLAQPPGSSSQHDLLQQQNSTSSIGSNKAAASLGGDKSYSRRPYKKIVKLKKRAGVWWLPYETSQGLADIREFRKDYDGTNQNDEDVNAANKPKPKVKIEIRQRRVPIVYE